MIMNGSYERLSAAEVRRLDQLDAEARKFARRHGHTHALAIGSAVTKDGKRIGYVCQ